MEENNGEVAIDAPIETAALPTPEQMQFQKNMAMAFGETIPNFEVPAPAETTEIHTQTGSEPWPIIDDNNQAALPTDYLKELGFETIDAAKSEIEQLRQLKSATPLIKEFEFADEESKTVHELVRTKEYKKLGKWIEAQELMANVDSMGEVEKLKLHIKMENPRFDQEMIDDEYDSLYTIDEDTIDDPFKLRKEKVRLQQRIENAAQKATEFFSQYAKKVELPDITKPSVTADPDYEDWKARTASISDFQENVIVPSIQSLTEDKVKMAINVLDENNQMNFGVSITPDLKDLQSAKNAVIDFNGFIKENFYDKDGNFKPETATKFVLSYSNFDKYVQSAARQAVNAERRRMVETDKGTGGIQRDTNVAVDRTDFQKQMDYALS